jgi:hypothetical protein
MHPSHIIHDCLKALERGDKFYIHELAASHWFEYTDEDRKTQTICAMLNLANHISNEVSEADQVAGYFRVCGVERHDDEPGWFVGDSNGDVYLARWVNNHVQESIKLSPYNTIKWVLYDPDNHEIVR